MAESSSPGNFYLHTTSAGSTLGACSCCGHNPFLSSTITYSTPSMTNQEKSEMLSTLSYTLRDGHNLLPETQSLIEQKIKEILESVNPY